MKRYILTRVAQAVLCIIAVSVIVFLLSRLTGDPLDLLLPIDATEQDRAILSKELGLDKGSSTPKAEVKGNLSIEQVKKIAGMKLDNLSAYTVKSAAKEVIGVCNSMGITVEGKHAKEAQKEVDKTRDIHRTLIKYITGYIKIKKSEDAELDNMVDDLPFKIFIQTFD